MPVQSNDDDRDGNTGQLYVRYSDFSKLVPDDVWSPRHWTPVAAYPAYGSATTGRYPSNSPCPLPFLADAEEIHLRPRKRAAGAGRFNLCPMGLV